MTFLIFSFMLFLSSGLVSDVTYSAGSSNSSDINPAFIDPAVISNKPISGNNTSKCQESIGLLYEQLLDQKEMSKQDADLRESFAATLDKGESTPNKTNSTVEKRIESTVSKKSEQSLEKKKESTLSKTSKNKLSKIDWKNFHQLKIIFGEPQSTSVVEETLYQWQDAQVLLRSGKVVQSMGKLPNFQDPNNVSADELIQKLGTPKSMEIGVLIKNSWVCEDPTNSLSAIVDKDGNVVTIMGTYCISASCYNFEEAGAPSPTNKNLSKPQKQ